MTTTNETDETHDELAAALRGAVPPAADAYRVERVLKSAPGELTQLVYLRTASGGELGPYVRKVIDRESGLGGAYVALAAREREGLRVRQLPRIIECGVERGSLVVVMERVPGYTLREVIEAASPAQRVELAARLMPAVCDAAEELHTTLEQPIVHRDLSPGNVMCPDGDPTTPVLIDLGIARTWHNDAETDTTHLGTRAYAPPEQYGFGQTDVRSDVYALGLLAFFCLTGRDPSPSDRERAFADPAVPEPWRVAIERAAALDPAERYQTAGELAAALRGLPATSALRKDPKPTATEPRTATAPPARAPRLWTPRNVIVAAGLALYLFGCVTDAVVLDYWAKASAAFNLFAFLVFMPYVGLVCAYALCDKRWLRSRVRWFRTRSALRVWRNLLLLLLALFAVLVVLVLVPLP